MLVFFHKLRFYGISGQIFGLISSFLSNRWLQVVLDGKSSQEYPVNAGVPQASILDPTLFLLYINDHPDDVVCDIAIYLIFGKNLNRLLNLNLIYKTMCTGPRSGLLISMLVKLNWFHLAGLIILILLM